MANSLRRTIGFLATCTLLLVPMSLHAQEAGEVSGFAGGSFGFGAHPMVGASAGTYLSRHALAVIETTFQPIGTHTIQPWPQRSAIDNSLLWDFSFCGHIRLRTTGRVQPYAIVGAGLLWDFIRQNGVDAYGNPKILHWDQANAALETGGGVRYYMGEEWGFRSEVKVIVNKDTFMRVSMGVFRELPSWWP